MRKAGILIPIASLPSKYGIGDFGPTSYEFVDLICQAHFKIWQILPLNPLGFGNSPYQAYSSKAMDELYISLETLEEKGLIKKAKKFNAKANKIDYDAVRKFKEPYFKEAYSNFKKNQAYKTFIQQEWVKEYATFVTLKQRNGLKCWNEWPQEDKEWIHSKNKLSQELCQEVEYRMFLQFILYEQWNKLRKYANRKGIELIGDIPIYVGIDSLDVWANQDSFLLDDDGRPTFIAGVPPDYFSAEGQRWGNPLYNWDKLKENGFAFWLDRLAYNANLFDRIRIDHFRAFDTYWKIPADCPTAIEGEWIEAPGYDLFDKIYETYPDIKIVAEDLGDLRPEVLELRDHYHLMGMRIVQHSFDPVNEMVDRENLLAYTGTHDNETLRVWYSHHDEAYKRLIHKFFKRNGYHYSKMSENMIQYTLDTKARYAILPMVDILNKNDSCRINFPGTVGNPNWQWKLKDYKEFEERLPLLKTMIKKGKRA
ncbi:MAG: 4-alpha-glucanotransferase [Traorella sp.]